MSTHLTKRQWAQMHDRLRCDLSLTPLRYRVLTNVLGHVSSKDRDLTQKTIANEIGRSVRTVNDGVRWLVENGYLIVRRCSNEHGYRTANEYHPGPVSLGEQPPPTRSQHAANTQKPAQQKGETTNPSSGLSSSEIPCNERRSVDLSTQSDAREGPPSPVNLSFRPPEISPPPPTGASPAVAAESGRSTHAIQEQPHVLRVPSPRRMTAIEKVLDRLERVQRNGTNTLASCPVTSHGRGNGDRNPSLSVTEHDGKVLLNCMSGCHVQDVVAALNLDWPDLFDEPITNDRGVKVAEWTYQAPDGSPYLTVERWQKPQGKSFIQRIPGSQTAGLPSSFKPCLFKLPKVLAAAKAGEEVYVVEGEKCVAAAERLGLTATTAPAGVNGWRDYYTKWLIGCSRVTIVCDNDEPGLRYAAAVAASLRGADIKVRTMKVGVSDPKADLYDHVLAGLGVNDLVSVKLNQFRPEGPKSNTLLDTVFPPVEWVIRDLMPIGFTVLGGAPKVGKSFITLDAAMNVALGGSFLHTQGCERGSVLYLSLDNDAQWRLQLRLKHLQMQYGVSLADTDIEFHTDFPTGDAAIKGIAEWCADQREEGKRPLLVVADTLAKAEPNFDGSSDRNNMNGGYGKSTANLSKWSQLALDQRIGVLATHHIRKGGDEDWMNRFIGSQGIVATATTLMMVDHKRGTKEATLHVSSRDAGDHELEMVRDGWSWNLIEQARAEHIVTTKQGLRVLPGGQS